jgi:UDPglucose 6-dehydrogenase
MGTPRAKPWIAAVVPMHSEFGVSMVGVDQKASKIARLTAGEMPIYEPGLAPLVAANVAAVRPSFTTQLAPAVAGSEAAFIAVGTLPRRGDGHADLSHVFAAAKDRSSAGWPPLAIP